MQVRVQIPDKLTFLLHPNRYKVLYGGRDGVKSWSIARSLLCLGTQRPLRILCARETQQSIRESVHQLLSEQVKTLGLREFYKVMEYTIKGSDGSAAFKDGKCTEFIFAGLRNLSVEQIKSFESIDIVWVEEAQGVGRKSWQTLIPTIRKTGSEIWVSFNPELAEDDTYKRWVTTPPPGTVVVKTSYRDNAWLSPESAAEIDYLRTNDPATFEHVYEGHPRSTIVGAIYAEEIKAAEQNQQFTTVPYDASRTVDTYWDLGYGDMVAVWFAQSFPFQYRIIDYYQNTRKGIDFYIQMLQQRGYSYGKAVLPWDGGTAQLGTGKSIAELMRAKGFTVHVNQTKQGAVADGINAVRTIFPQCWFDADKCEEGLRGLRRYQWGPPSIVGKSSGAPATVARREPVHDDASHPADALRTMAMSIKTPVVKKPRGESQPMRVSAWS